jgi:hypothetical protein
MDCRDVYGSSNTNSGIFGIFGNRKKCFQINNSQLQTLLAQILGIFGRVLGDPLLSPIRENCENFRSYIRINSSISLVSLALY